MINPMRKIIKWILIILGMGILIYGGVRIYLIATLFDSIPSYHSYQELVDNYKQKTRDITDLKWYINSIVPPDKYVYIEFDDDQKLGIFHVQSNGVFENNWDIVIGTGKADSLLQQLNWTEETLKTLKGKLDNAHCISIASGARCNIGFQRSGMGKYSYDLFNKPIADSLKTSYNDSCLFILYNDTVVFEYGGGAIGPQCFPDFR